MTPVTMESTDNFRYKHHVSRDWGIHNVLAAMNQHLTLSVESDGTQK